jgi:hypothetical protein
LIIVVWWRVSLSPSLLKQVLYVIVVVWWRVSLPPPSLKQVLFVIIVVWWRVALFPPSLKQVFVRDHRGVVARNSVPPVAEAGVCT